MTTQARITCAALLGLSPVVASAEINPAPYRAVFDACVVDGAKMADLNRCIGEASDLCQGREDDGYSTVGMMFCALMERDLWDEKLNTAYQEQMTLARMIDQKSAQYSDDAYANLEDSLRDAQRAWITFRDAQCALEYARWGSGSMRNIIGADCHLTMTAERTIYLMTASQDMADE